jgi:hypothetical protein
MKVSMWNHRSINPKFDIWYWEGKSTKPIGISNEKGTDVWHARGSRIGAQEINEAKRTALKSAIKDIEADVIAMRAELALLDSNSN